MAAEETEDRQLKTSRPPNAEADEDGAGQPEAAPRRGVSVRTRITLGLCLALSVLFSTNAWVHLEAIGKLDPNDILRQPLSLVWLWSLVILPLPIALSYLPWRLPLIAGMATVLYTPIYFIWASFFAGPNGLHPDVSAWAVMTLIVLGIEGALSLRLLEGQNKERV